MAKVKVPQFRSTRSVTVDPDATPGAVVGVNLFNADGTLFDPATLPANESQPSTGIALDDVQALSHGPITVDGSPAEGAFDYGWDGTTSDVPEGSRLYYTDDRVRKVLGRSVVQFAFGDASPAQIYVAPNNRLAVRARVVIDTPFDGTGAALKLGTSAMPDSMLADTDSDPATAGGYEAGPDVDLATGDVVQLSITPGAGATQGAGRIIFDAYER